MTAKLHGSSDARQPVFDLQLVASYYKTLSQVGQCFVLHRLPPFASILT
jgi:hypothetical protein